MALGRLVKAKGGVEKDIANPCPVPTTDKTSVPDARGRRSLGWMQSAGTEWIIIDHQVPAFDVASSTPFVTGLIIGLVTMTRLLRCCTYVGTSCGGCPQREARVRAGTRKDLLGSSAHPAMVRGPVLLLKRDISKSWADIKILSGTTPLHRRSIMQVIAVQKPVSSAQLPSTAG